MEDEMSFRFGEGQAIFTGEVLVLGGVISRLFHDLRRLSIEDANFCSNIFQWILYKWKGMTTALFCLSIVASLGPAKPAVPVKKMSFWSCLMVGPPLVVNSLLGQDPIYSALW